MRRGVVRKLGTEQLRGGILDLGKAARRIEQMRRDHRVVGETRVAHAAPRAERAAAVWRRTPPTRAARREEPLERVAHGLVRERARAKS